MKISISVLNLITVSAKKSTIYDLLLFLIAMYSPENDKHPAEMRN